MRRTLEPHRIPPIGVLIGRLIGLLIGRLIGLLTGLLIGLSRPLIGQLIVR